MQLFNILVLESLSFFLELKKKERWLVFCSFLKPSFYLNFVSADHCSSRPLAQVFWINERLMQRKYGITLIDKWTLVGRTTELDGCACICAPIGQYPVACQFQLPST